MKYLCTGGAGFICSHLVDRLVKDGHEVNVIDNLSTGKLENLPIDAKPPVTFYEGSILDDSEKLKPMFEGVDVVFHLAALTRPRESYKNPKKTFNINVDGTINTILSAKRAFVKRFVFISSATVYSKLPMKESDLNLTPLSPYGKSKLQAETCVKDFCNMKYNIIRPFNVYGKRQDPSGEYGAAIPKFIDTFKKEKQPYITGNGSQFRDFIYIDDLIELLVKVAHSKVHGEIFNAGSGKTTSVNKLYKLISKIMSKKVKPRYIKEIKEPNTEADISKAKKLLNWYPKINLEEGLRRII